MPTFIKPQSVTVVEGGGGFPWELAGGLATAAAVAVFVFAHLVFIAVGLVAVAVVTGITVLALRRFMVLDFAPRPVQATVAAAVIAEAISAPRREAIEAPAQHLHIHFHGLAPDDAAAVIRQAIPGRPAVEEDL